MKILIFSRRFVKLDAYLLVVENDKATIFFMSVRVYILNYNYYLHVKLIFIFIELVYRNVQSVNESYFNVYLFRKCLQLCIYKYLNNCS